MSDARIIARATPAGTRRLRAVPSDAAIIPAASVAEAEPATTQLSGLNAFLEGARRQGAELVAVAREQAEAIAANAREQGFAAGYEAGLKRGEKAAADLIAHAEQTAREVTRHRDETIASSERELVELSLAVAAKILQRTFAAEPDRVVDVLRGALRKTYTRDGLTVVCHPDDMDRLKAAGPTLAGTLGGLQDLSFVTDRRVAPGGVVVRTPTGDIDATINSQLDKLAALLLEGSDDE